MFKLRCLVTCSFLLCVSIANAKTTINFNFDGKQPHHPPPPEQPYDHYEIMPLPQNAPYHWRAVEYGEIPPHAVIGGYENNRPLYLCQTFYNGGVHPGKVVAGNCNITYGGNEITRQHFRILVGRGLGWEKSRRGFIPPDAVPDGFENGHPLFICHANYFNGIHPGKIIAGACNIGYGGEEIRIQHYEILVS